MYTLPAFKRYYPSANGKDRAQANRFSYSVNNQKIRIEKQESAGQVGIHILSPLELILKVLANTF
jgi:hypothetical protein